MKTNRTYTCQVSGPNAPAFRIKISTVDAQPGPKNWGKILFTFEDLLFETNPMLPLPISVAIRQGDRPVEWNFEHERIVIGAILWPYTHGDENTASAVAMVFLHALLKVLYPNSRFKLDKVA